MRITAWRIVKSSLARRAFDGEGDGRWNSDAATIVDVAGSMSLAMLEILAHLKTPELRGPFALSEVSFDDRLIQTLAPSRLPRNWQKHPAPPALKEIGDRWFAAGRSVILRVPSVIVPTEWNYLLNPKHPDFHRVKIGRRQSFRFDRRLLGT